MASVGKHSLSFPAILLLAVSFRCAMSPLFSLFSLESLPHYVASKKLQCVQDSLNCSFGQDGSRDSCPADHSQPLCTGIWHPGFPNARTLLLGWAGCTHVVMVALSQPELTTLVPLLQCCRSPGLELCCTRFQLRPPSYKLLKILVEISL